MGKIIMCSMEYDASTLEIMVDDVQRIDHLPLNVAEVIKENCGNRKCNKSGLPSVLYIGEDSIKITGAFKYGDVAFMEVEGKWQNIEGGGFMCITAYRENQSYEELKEGKEEYLKSIEEKYPNGLTVGEEE